MKQKEITIGLPSGLEAKPVAMFVQIAGKFQCQISVEYNRRQVNAKSIMGMMSLGIAQGEKVKVTADGPDEDEAIQNIEIYLTGEE